MLCNALGTALHNVAEKSEVENHINEQRLIHEIDGTIRSNRRSSFRERRCVNY